MISYRSTVVVLGKIVRRLDPKLPRRVAHQKAEDATHRLFELTAPVRHPVIWVRSRYIGWQVRRGTWGIRV